MKISQVDRKTITRLTHHLHLVGGPIFKETKMMGFETATKLFPHRREYERMVNLTLYSLYTYKYHWQNFYVTFLEIDGALSTQIRRGELIHGTSKAVDSIAGERALYLNTPVSPVANIVDSGWMAVPVGDLEVDNVDLMDFMKHYRERDYETVKRAS